jgi:hypothetical protein
MSFKQHRASTELPDLLHMGENVFNKDFGVPKHMLYAMQALFVRMPIGEPLEPPPYSRTSPASRTDSAYAQVFRLIPDGACLDSAWRTYAIELVLIQQAMHEHLTAAVGPTNSTWQYLDQTLSACGAVLNWLRGSETGDPALIPLIGASAMQPAAFLMAIYDSIAKCEPRYAGVAVATLRNSPYTTPELLCAIADRCIAVLADIAAAPAAERIVLGPMTHPRSVTLRTF